MPRVREEQIEGWAHCPDPRCTGYSQESVRAVRVITETTFVENGGDLPGVERSFQHVTLIDEGDRQCRSCGKAREVTDQKRRVYAPLSGHDQNGLLKFGGFDPAYQPPKGDDKVAALEAQIAELKALVEAK